MKMEFLSNDDVYMFIRLFVPLTFMLQNKKLRNAAQMKIDNEKVVGQRNEIVGICTSLELP